MKKVIAVLILLLILTQSAYAQTTADNPVQQNTQQELKVKNAKSSAETSKKNRLRPQKPVITSLFEKKDSIGELELRWKSVKHASGYQIAVRKVGSKKWHTKNEEIFTVYSYNGSCAYIGCNTDYQYEFKVRAYRIVNGKRIYGLYSKPYAYRKTWDSDELRQTIEERLINEYGAEINDAYADGEIKTPQNSSWSSCWPMNISKYARLEDAAEYILENQYTHFGLGGQSIKVWIEDYDMYCSIIFLEG